jgi:choline dehydrogenase-like flavoprotein
MALGHVLGGGSSINGVVWGRGMQRDFDGCAQNGAAGWGFDDVLPAFKAQQDWEGGASVPFGRRLGRRRFVGHAANRYRADERSDVYGRR